VDVKRRWLMILIAANLVALVALAFIFPEPMVSPGPLVPAHADLSENCFACHAPFRGAASKRCVSCHAAPDIGLRTTKGMPITQPAVKTSFHQELIEQDCMACHTDHQGRRFTLRSQHPFSHALLRPGTRDRCEACHAAPKNNIHRDLSVSCKQCHSTERWKPATFDHAKFFVLDSNHNPTCVTCHTANDYSRYTCYGCHEHQPDNMQAKHISEGIRDFENCVRCHRSGSEGGERD
jgi:hypothetical protein